MRASTWPLLLALASFACRHETATATPTDDPARASSRVDAGSTSVRRPGAAHVAAIDFVSLARDGSMAISRDATGSIRLWTALDGTAEPMVVPHRGAAFATVERHRSGATLFVVDAAGGGKLLSVDAAGQLAERAALPPFEPLLEGHVLPGGERVLVLGRDHVLRLLDRDGQVLTRFEDRRFAPKRLLVSSTGETVLAIVPKTRSSLLEVQRLRVTDTRIERLGSPRLVEATAEISPHTSSMSPDAKRFAVVDKSEGVGWGISVFDLEDPDATPKRHVVELPNHMMPALGFVSPTRLLVHGSDGALSWVVDVERDQTYARAAPPQDFGRERALAFARERHVSGYGNWLFVHDVETRAHRFLGYDALQAQTIALSPSGSHVAWGYSQGAVFVESIAEGEEASTQLPGEPSHWPLRVRFLDDEHVLVAESNGALILYHWPTRREIDAVGIFGGVRELAVAHELGLVLVDGHMNVQRVYEVSPEGFGRVHLLADRAYRGGLLDARASDQPMLWTLDSGNRLRTYRLDDLRADFSRETTRELGSALPTSQPVPLAIDSTGRHYGVQWNGQGMELYVRDAGRTTTGSFAGDNVNQIVPSPRGDRFVAVAGSGVDLALRAYDAQTLDQLWSFSSGVHPNDIVWSSDGHLVGMAAMNGAVLLDAESGTPRRRRCGLGFRISSAPPPNPFAALDRPSVCE